MPPLGDVKHVYASIDQQDSRPLLARHPPSRCPFRCSSHHLSRCLFHLFTYLATLSTPISPPIPPPPILLLSCCYLATHLAAHSAYQLQGPTSPCNPILPSKSNSIKTQTIPISGLCEFQTISFHFSGTKRCCEGECKHC